MLLTHKSCYIHFEYQTTVDDSVWYVLDFFSQKTLMDTHLFCISIIFESSFHKDKDFEKLVIKQKIRFYLNESKI